MGASVIGSQGLDKSGWTAEQIGRSDRLAQDRAQFRAFKAAMAAHPLADSLEGLDDPALAVSGALRFRMKSREWDNGHREVTIWREQPELQRTLEKAIERDCRKLAPRGEGNREASIEASVRRSTQKVRLLCKSMCVNSLWTLTYRANVRDREQVLKHLDLFRRRVVKGAGLEDWRYIAVLEKQGRGAYHVHIATHALPKQLLSGGVKLKSWDVMRAIWRRITGELGGNFDEAKRTCRWSQRKKPIRGAGNIARYIAGYVAKDMRETALNRKRYSRSEGVDVPEAYRALFPADTPWTELITLAHAALGRNVTATWFDAERGIFFAESDDSRFAERPPGLVH